MKLAAIILLHERKTQIHSRQRKTHGNRTDADY